MFYRNRNALFNSRKTQVFFMNIYRLRQKPLAKLRFVNISGSKVRIVCKVLSKNVIVGMVFFAGVKDKFDNCGNFHKKEKSRKVQSFNSEDLASTFNVLTRSSFQYELHIIRTAWNEFRNLYFLSLRCQIETNTMKCIRTE